jgi:hypothetical protein
VIKHRPPGIGTPFPMNLRRAGRTSDGRSRSSNRR